MPGPVKAWGLIPFLEAEEDRDQHGGSVSVSPEPCWEQAFGWRLKLLSQDSASGVWDG